MDRKTPKLSHKFLSDEIFAYVGNMQDQIAAHDAEILIQAAEALRFILSPDEIGERLSAAEKRVPGSLTTSLTVFRSGFDNGKNVYASVIVGRGGKDVSVSARSFTDALDALDAAIDETDFDGVIIEKMAASLIVDGTFGDVSSSHATAFGDQARARAEEIAKNFLRDASNE